MQTSKWPGPIGALALSLSITAACEPTDRGEVRTPLTTQVAGDAGAVSTEDETQLPITPSETPPGEEPAPIATLQPGTGLGGQATGGSCEGDAGTCVPGGDAGPLPSVCVSTGARDCTSELDNDCDGQPDNVIDDVCVCAPGSVEPCDEHPGLDGRGQCVAGSRACIPSEGNVSSDWGACEGSVGPAEADACTAGDDGDCDGTPNEDCPCVDGQTQACGPSSDNGICQRGVSTCVNAAFGECVGAVFPGARDCSSAQDNDCDGRPDNTIDNTCTCAIGAVQACGAHPGDGNGQCRAGSQTCQGRANNSTSGFGACTGSVGPAPQDSCAEGNDGNCNGVENEDCDCINGATRRCGSTDTGSCSFGTETCVNGQFGACQGAVGPAPADSCTEGNDATCNGVQNEGCECFVGEGNGPCSDDPNNSHCNGQGRCAPCQSDADCSLLSGGRNTCADGQCVSPAEPFVCGEDAPPLAPLPSARTVPGNPPAPAGGTIANGRYVLTQIDFYGAFTSVPGEGMEFQDGFVQRRHTTYLASSGQALSGFTQAGSYTTTGTSVAVDMTTCQPSGVGREIWGYTASGTELQLFKLEGAVRTAETYLLQP